MPQVTFPGRTVDVPPGTSILDAALDHGVAMPHECGGVCACTTCHVHVVQGMASLTPLDEIEEERLSGLPRRRPDSRLACQARVWGDVTVAFPKEDPVEETQPTISREKVEETLDKIREWIAADGGYVELVNINDEDGVVFIRFQGACSG